MQNIQNQNGAVIMHYKAVVSMLVSKNYFYDE